MPFPLSRLIALDHACGGAPDQHFVGCVQLLADLHRPQPRPIYRAFKMGRARFAINAPVMSEQQRAAQLARALIKIVHGA
jgi:hypothetical protein